MILAACAAGGTDQPVFVADFVDRAAPVHCTLLPTLSERQSAVATAVTASDTSALILYSQDRELVVVGADLEPRFRLRFEADGPTGVLGPTGAALVGDSLFYIADQKRQQLKAFGLDGRERGTIPLDFSPQALQSAGGQLLISPMVIVSHPLWLLYTLEGDRVRNFPLPIAQYADPMVNYLANLASVAAYPDGRVVLTHAMVIPFASTFTLDAPDSVRRLPLPLPDGVRDRYGYLPGSRATEDELAKLLIATIATAPDLRTGDLLYLTKTGRKRGEQSEKALIRVDSELRHRRSYLLDVNAMHLAYLAGSGTSLVANEEDQWYQCPTP
jgi:hypothetical protein